MIGIMYQLTLKKYIMIELILIVVLPIIFGGISIHLLSKWKLRENFIFINLVLMIIYIIAILYFNYNKGNSDPFRGISNIIMIFVFIISHSILALIFAIIKNRQLKKTIANKEQW